MGRRSLASETADHLHLHFGKRAFTAEQAAAVGISRGRLATAARAGSIQRLRRGVYAATLASNSDRSPGARAAALRDASAVALAEAAATALILPTAAVSHSPAATLLQLPVPLNFSGQAHVTHPGARVRSVGGVRIHASALPPGHRVVRQGIPVTSPARTAIDIARMSSLPQALICVDALLRRTIEESDPDGVGVRLALLDEQLREAAREPLRKVIADMKGWPGIPVARRALELSDPGAESPLESESRGVFIEHGLPVPECGAPVKGADGLVYWADMVWRERRVIGECDGALKYADPDALYREKLRQEALERAGWRVIRWRYAELLRHQQRLIDRLTWALFEANARPVA